MGSWSTLVAKCPQIANFVKLTTPKTKEPRRIFVVLVRFVHPVAGRHDYIFGCVRAIFDHFSSRQIGASLQDMRNANAGKGRKVVTRFCTVERIEVFPRRHAGVEKPVRKTRTRRAANADAVSPKAPQS